MIFAVQDGHHSRVFFSAISEIPATWGLWLNSSLSWFRSISVASVCGPTRHVFRQSAGWSDWIFSNSMFSKCCNCCNSIHSSKRVSAKLDFWSGPRKADLQNRGSENVYHPPDIILSTKQHHNLRPVPGDSCMAPACFQWISLFYSVSADLGGATERERCLSSSENRAWGAKRVKGSRLQGFGS